MQTRLLLVSHPATRAMRVGAFPADDPLDPRALDALRAWHGRALIVAQGVEAAQVFRSAATCVRETAEALGLEAQIAPALSDADAGEWRGRRLHELAATQPEALAAWSRSPDAAPSAGESFRVVLARVGAWLDALAPSSSASPAGGMQVIALTHAVVIRAALIHVLGAPAESFGRIEIAPLSIVELRRSREGAWTWWPGAG
ncbi:MAG: histidine phosphatase family protein [Paraburkholderia sp.]|uniref:histidine phosphatase family protein n=1 Tax=Paraburkholderia sp. TaxID=1926495 RepID=UPI001215F076|nr:histidine phosphatase family protein [Paraburkholderia sp.]TAL94069.1 MAG: histidine phosphatase family protein [Paraburkholderia sp.]